MIVALLLHGADPNLKDRTGDTPLESITDGEREGRLTKEQAEEARETLLPWIDDRVGEWRRAVIDHWPSREMGRLIRLRYEDLYRDLMHIYLLWQRMRGRIGGDKSLRHEFGKAMISLYEIK